MRETEFDFGMARQAKNQLHDAAARMDTEILTGMEEALQEISQSWSTEAGDQFRGLAAEEFRQMQRAARLLHEAEVSLKEAIVTARQTEEKAKEVARLRTY